MLLLASLNIWDLSHEAQDVRSFNEAVFSLRGVQRIFPAVLSVFIFILTDYKFIFSERSKYIYLFLASFGPGVFINSPNIVYSLSRLVEYAVLVYCFDYYLTAQDKKISIQIILAYSTLILCYQPFLGLILNGFYLPQPNFITRYQLQGLLPVLNPNGYATSASIFFLFVWYNYRRDIFRTVVLLVLGLILILTFSRTTLASLAVVFFFLQRRRLSISLRLAATVVVVAGIILNWSSIFELMVRGNSAQFFTLTGRTVFWEEAINQILNKPFIGNGYAAGTRYLVMPLVGHEGASTLHNTWLEVILGGGILSFLLFIFCLKKIFPDIKNTAPWFKGVIVLLLVKSFTNTLAVYNDSYLLIVILVIFHSYADTSRSTWWSSAKQS